MAAYTQRRRLDPKIGGTMWIVGQPGDLGSYSFSKGMEAPATIVLTDVPTAVKEMAQASGARIVECNRLRPDEFEALKNEQTHGLGFDDIVVLNPSSAVLVSRIAKLIARRGTCNLVGDRPLDGLVEVDLGRLHYDYIAFLGNPGPDIAASYTTVRNRCELRPGGTAVFIGAGGPMGQMHVQHALELPGGPSLILATEVSVERLKR